MSWILILVLVAAVIVLAYALGSYLRRQGELPGVLRPASPQKPPPTQSITDREVRAAVTWLLSQAFEQTGVKVADDKIAYQRIVEAAQKAIQDLKTQDTVTVSLPFLTADATRPKHLEARLTREVIKELAKD